MTPLLALLAAEGTPGWLSTLGLVISAAVTTGALVWRGGGRAQRQDMDGRTVEKTADATQRHDVVDATMGQTLKGLTDAVGKMDGKLDAVVGKLGSLENAQVRADTQREALVEKIARAESIAEAARDAVAAAEARHATALAEVSTRFSSALTEQDQRHAAALTAAVTEQNAARHALRDQTHSVMGDGFSRGLDLLERFVERTSPQPANDAQADPSTAAASRRRRRPA